MGLYATMKYSKELFLFACIAVCVCVSVFVSLSFGRLGGVT